MRFCLSIMFCLLLVSSVAGSETWVAGGSYDKAKIRAKEEGKMLFLDFYADWCTPCKWMEETTFKDAEVLSLLKQNFVSVKINIDDFEGFELKSKFDIRFLPTILIFNSEGVMIERREETLSAKMMKSVLATHVGKAPTTSIVHKVNTAPSKAFTALPKEEPAKLAADIPEHKTFRLQLAVFSKEEGAVKKSEELKANFKEPVSIMPVEKEGKTLYRVLMGNFSNQADARIFQDKLQKERNLASLVF
ncbi:MAG: thioredoxin family protein [Saprospiraceae bacterium]|nr:thioredoxin family protein [Saprospiraceae bacterium]